MNNPSAFHLSIWIWERTSNQRRQSSTRSLQLVTHRRVKRKALLKAKLQGSFKQTLQTKLWKKSSPYLKKKTPYGERLSANFYQQHTLISEISRNDTSPPQTKQYKETYLALRSTILHSSSKSERNHNEEVLPNTVKTICKPKFQGAANNILQKGAFTQRPTRKSNIIAKARKPNHVFSGVVWSCQLLFTC